MLKFISWNVNGLRACVGKGFEEVFKTLDADFFCLQETKMQPHQLDLRFPGYTSYWNSAEKKGYSGTAIYTREAPVAVTYGMGMEEHDKEGRIITLEMPDFYLVCVYVPNSQDELRRLDYRMQWEDAFRYVTDLAAKKELVICGDLNVAHKEIDIKNAASVAATQDLPTRSGASSDLLNAGSSTPGGCSILTKSNIPGGPTVSAHGEQRRLAHRLFASENLKDRLQAPTSQRHFRFGPLSRGTTPINLRKRSYRQWPRLSPPYRGCAEHLHSPLARQTGRLR